MAAWVKSDKYLINFEILRNYVFPVQTQTNWKVLGDTPEK